MTVCMNFSMLVIPVLSVIVIFHSGIKLRASVCLLVFFHQLHLIFFCYLFFEEINMVVCLFWLGSVKQQDQGYKVLYQISQRF